MSRNEFLNLTELKAAGWSRSMIDSILGEPDETRTNPRYRSAAPVCLWRKTRVEAPDVQARFAEAREAGAARREGAAKAVATKKAALAAEVAELPINVPTLSAPVVVARGIDAWESRQIERGRYDSDGANADAATLERWARNWLRHEATVDYERALGAIAGRVGTDAAYETVRARIGAAIDAAYPDLAAAAAAHVVEREEATAKQAAKRAARNADMTP